MVGKRIDEIFPYLREKGIVSRLADVVRKNCLFDTEDVHGFYTRITLVLGNEWYN